MKNRLLGLLLAITAAPVLAQPAAEPVYSAARRDGDESMARQLVQAMLVEAYGLEGQYAKWHQPICIRILGLAPVTAFQLDRGIKDVAARIGAPVNRDEGCAPNIGIVVSPDPKATLELMASTVPKAYASGLGKDEKFPYPVQSWHATIMRDYQGRRQLNMPWEESDGINGLSPLDSLQVHVAARYSVSASPRTGARANLSRLRTGQTAELAATVIVLDANKIAGKSVGALSDYFALMALAMHRFTNVCQPVPSIANLMVEGCANTTSALSDTDIALLTGLYATPEEPERVQKARIIGNMREKMEALFIAGQKR
jgi:hypothetical protein